jgi:hypothetical protein
MNVKRTLGVIAATATFAIAGATPAFAGSAGDGSGYGTQPGYDTAQTNSNGCAGHGSFGAFGKDYNFSGGANGQLTGYNNSHLCGNPQN